MTYEPIEDDRYHPDQLSPVKGGRYTTVLHGPPGTDIGDLHCDLEPYMEGDRPAIVSHSGWHVRPDHLEKLAAGAHLRMGVWQHPIPPLSLSVEPPVCACHNEPCSYDDVAAQFYCDKSGTYFDPTLDAMRKAQADDPLDQAHRDFKPGEPESE